MDKWYLGINDTHDASITLIKNKEIIFNIKSERINHYPHSSNSFPALTHIQKFTKEIDICAYSFLHNSCNNFSAIKDFLSMIGINVRQYVDYSGMHHFLHAFGAFRNSGFNDAIVVVIDGAGSDFPPFRIGNSILKENESVFYFNKKNKVTYSLYKTFVGLNSGTPSNPVEPGISLRIGAGFVYDAVSQGIGFKSCQEGKTMGLSAYASYDDVLTVPDLLSYKTGGNEDIFDFVECHKYGYIAAKFKVNPLDNLSDDEKWRTAIKYAGKLQYDYQNYIGQICNIALNRNKDCKNLVVTGGSFMNCVGNYALLKLLPKEYNLYVEPMCTDEGISFSAALLASLDDDIFCGKDKLTTLYYGSQLEYNYKLLEGQSEKDVKPLEVAKLLSEGNVVAIAQGKAEIGQRALGNRSILFDPRNKDGLSIVNHVKKREEWRPFAGTIMLEHAKDWFDMDRLDESPFMTYAVNALPGTYEKVPAIIHANNTCRIQTLTKEQNKNYYKLIDEFYKLTGVPMVLNTSFNLSGSTIVEFIDDAIYTMNSSKIEYLYLPEIGKLLYFPNDKKDNIC